LTYTDSATRKIGCSRQLGRGAIPFADFQILETASPTPLEAIMKYLRGLILRRGPAVVLALATVGVLWAFGYSYYARTMSDPYRSRRFDVPQPVRTAQVETKEVEKVIGGTCVTLASKIAIVALGSSQILYPDSGPAAELRFKVVNVHEGDYVKANQILYELDQAPFEAFLKQRQAATVAAETQLNYIKESLPLNEAVRKIDLQTAQNETKFRKQDMTSWENGVRIYRDLMDKHIESAINYYTAQSTYLLTGFNYGLSIAKLERAKNASQIGALKDNADYTAAKSTYETAVLAEKQLQHDLARLKVPTPIDGWVTYATKPEIIIGGLLTKTDATMCHVVQLDPLFARMDFPQERVDDVYVGQKARIVLDAWPQESFEGTVVRISPAVSPQTRTTPVEIEIKNPGGRIKSGISGFARLYVKNRTTEVPAAAVFQGKNNAFVLRVEDNKAVARQVHTLRVAELGMLEVKEGLKAGDEVVLFNGFYHDMGKLVSNKAFVQDGDVVRTDWREWTRRQ
jgi:RND family efflux transporter MFP subunit